MAWNICASSATTGTRTSTRTRVYPNFSNIPKLLSGVDEWAFDTSDLPINSYFSSFSAQRLWELLHGLSNSTTKPVNIWRRCGCWRRRPVDDFFSEPLFRRPWATDLAADHYATWSAILMKSITCLSKSKDYLSFPYSPKPAWLMI